MATPPTPLKSLLLETLGSCGPMTFERYMELCLYHSDYGYYTQGRERTGVRGDYFTSPDLHPIFARLLARQAAEIWELLGQPRRLQWAEMGAGRGLFARDFLEWSRSALPEFFAALDYSIVEPAPRNQALLAEKLTGERCRVLASLEELDPAVGCFFSNELVDAFPAAVVTRAGGHFKEVYVTAEGEDLREKLGPISDSTVAAAVARYANQLEEGHRVEVSRRAVQWMEAVAEKLERGFVITIDYGDLAERLFTPDRPRGTLLAYHGHVSSENFLDAPGERDLTAHVNFSALIDAGRQAGLEPTGFTTQERFILALGETNQFADLYDESQTEAGKLDARLKLKRLINPEGMGNVFKVLVQHRGLAEPKLTGLKFQRP